MSAPITNRRDKALRAALVLAVISFACWLALHDGRADQLPEDAEEVVPLARFELRCRLQGPEAVAHARVIEQMASARWERVPFALHEAPLAAVQMAEAEACYAAASDREGRLRSEGKRRRYEAEVQQRFARARLLLRAATLRDVEPERAAEREALAHRQVLTLLALLQQAPASTASYRVRLAELDREYAASAAERARGSKEEP